MSSTDEVCYGTARDEAYVNVHQYGVYDENGDQAGLSGGSFPIRAEMQMVTITMAGLIIGVFGLILMGENFDPTNANLAEKR